MTRNKKPRKNIDTSLLMNRASIALTGLWPSIILVTVIYFVLTLSLQFYFSNGFAKEILATLTSLLSAPLTTGLAKTALEVYRKNKFTPKLLLAGFEPKKLIISIVTNLLVILSFILGIILLIIPGIWVSLAFSQIKYIIAEGKLSNPIDILKKSHLLMKGHKRNYIFLSLRLFFLSLLCILTLGLGMLWFFPYAEVVTAAFYDEISGRGPSKKLKDLEQCQLAAQAANNENQATTSQNSVERKPFKAPSFEVDVNLVLIIVGLLAVFGYFLFIPK